MKPVVSLRNISKQYMGAKTPIFHDVTLDLHKGEFSALLGPSGSGKSTLLHCIAGLTTPSGGEITFQGQALSEVLSEHRRKFYSAQIGIMFQEPVLVPYLSIRENIALGTMFASKKASPKHIDHVIAEVMLGGFEDAPVAQLSGGQKQRVALARAMIHRPALLLADEPTGNLDPESGKVIVELLRTMAHDHQTAVLFVTHERPYISHADKVYHLKTGQLS